MGQSLVRNYLHIIFSTKHRARLIQEPVEKELFNYIGGICNSLECTPVIIGGHVDHVHILALLSKKIALAKLLETTKSNSSRWIKSKGKEFENFYWQDGYGAFSVYPNEIDQVKTYIKNQKKHHQKQSFQDEYRDFLKKYEIEFDERFVWE
jgi:putative transposase